MKQGKQNPLEVINKNNQISDKINKPVMEVIMRSKYWELMQGKISLEEFNKISGETSDNKANPK